MAAHAALADFMSPATVDVHLSDQLLVPLALFGGAFSARVLTLHAETVCRLLEMFGYDMKPRIGSMVEYSA
jgi:RNA 3'-terminal phosphate cyclase (ATP)